MLQRRISRRNPHAIRSASGMCQMKLCGAGFAITANGLSYSAKVGDRDVGLHRVESSCQHNLFCLGDCHDLQRPLT